MLVFLWQNVTAKKYGPRGVRDFGAPSSKWDVFIQPLPSRLRDLRRRGGRKSVRARGGGGLQGSRVLQTQQDCCTCELRRLWKHTQNLQRINPDGVPALRRGHEAPRRYLSLISAGKGNRTPGQAQCPGKVGQHKINCTIFMGFLFGLSTFFFLSYWVFVWFGFCLCFWEGGYEIGWVERKCVGSGSHGGRGNMTKIYENLTDK